MIEIIIKELHMGSNGDGIIKYKTIEIESLELEELLNSEHGYYIPSVIGACIKSEVSND